MGALHEGHGSLVAAARERCASVATTIFVNPLQFGQARDLETYPKTLDADLELLEAAGCDLVFAPSVTEIYPTFPVLPSTTVSVRGPALGFEGADRVGHFDGVATVVTLLFNLTGPCSAFFGEKDFQQFAVVRQMVADLGLPVEIVGCPTIRDVDGLALSSRNRRLSPEGRAAAPVLIAALEAGRASVERGEGAAAAVAAMERVVAAEELASLFYAAVVDPSTFEVSEELAAGAAARLLIAAEIDGVRLLDNVGAIAGSEG
jgi:pantoate--beta-alanine ligase